jgi:hypothetical protein
MGPMKEVAEMRFMAAVRWEANDVNMILSN